MAGVAIVVFSDLVDSTALLARLGDDRMEQVRLAHVKDVAEAVEDQGGRVVKTLGDGVMASFESALGALRAAAEIQASVERLDVSHGEIGIAARVGVAAGEPIADGDDLHGMAVVIAARLSSAAGTSEVLVHDLVGALVASREGVELVDSNDYELKGVPSMVRASKLRWRESVGGPAEAEYAPEATSAPSIRLPPLLASYAAQPLIGRDREIEALRKASAPRPGRHAVLVLGEPGIGKTRHAAAAAADAHEDGSIVVLARCPPEAVIAFEPWVRAIGELASAGDEAWQLKLADAAGAELAALVPELSEHAAGRDGADASAVIAAEGARYRLLRGISAALGFAARDAPLHVVLDDAHWCDPASAQALGHLLESPPTQLALVVTARDQEMGRGHPVSRVLGDLRRTRELTELQLGGLDADGLAALVSFEVGRSITPDLAARLRARTAGNPFFASELVRDLDESGALSDSKALEAAPVPDAVADLVEERLARLGPEAEKLLVAVAAIGPSAPIPLAARSAGIEPDLAERAMQEALSERLVEELDTAKPTVTFPHALIREALTARATGAARARLHLEIARALEQGGDAGPADLARHYGMAVSVAGPEPAIAAHQLAAKAAAADHDHEQAARHLRDALSLFPDVELVDRAPLLLELGEQELLAADLVSARQAFRAAGDAARQSGDVKALARAALGFAGGDIGFGWELDADDSATQTLLREGLDALGSSEPRLALQIVLRLAYSLLYTGEDAVLPALVTRAEELGERLEDGESRTLVRFVTLTARLGRSRDPLHVLDQLEEADIWVLAEESGRDDLLFRTLQWKAVVAHLLRDNEGCEAAIERSAQIAEGLGSPRFTWEVDVMRGQRLMDQGERVAGEALLRRGAAVVRTLRPDIQIVVELSGLTLSGWLYESDVALGRIVFESMANLASRGFMAAAITFGAAFDGDAELARERLAHLLDGDLEAMRQPDLQLPAALCLLALAAVQIGDREAGAKLRPLLEELRPYRIQGAPSVCFGHLPEWHIGRLELLAEHPEAAVDELRTTVSEADRLKAHYLTAWARIDLATALHRRGEEGDSREALELLAGGESIAAEAGLSWVVGEASKTKAEIEGRRPEAPQASPERKRPVRALASRGGRRALAALVRGSSEAEIEQRFADPSRQRALLKATARGFQPAHANGFSGVIAYELTPFAIDPPSDAPWRWALQVDSARGQAHLIEPAPLDASVTIHFGLAEWVRVSAGLQDALSAIVAGRCSVEGDSLLAVRLETMFGGA